MTSFDYDKLVALLQSVDPSIYDEHVGLLAAIALAESRGDILAAHSNPNGSIDRGLWQINSVHSADFPQFADFKLACYSPVSNAVMAIAIYRKQGFNAWDTYKYLL